MSGKARAIFGAVVAALMVVFVVIVAGQWRECDKRGGAFVRGAIWFSCVAKAA